MPQKKMSPSIDWNSVEAALERLTRYSLSEFGAIHSGETFYGFAFECNPSYGHAIPCLNTLERLEQAVDGDIRPKIMMNEEVRRTFDRWADDNPDSAFSTIMPVYERLFGLDGGKPAPRSERADALRWVLPLWKYCKIANPAHDAGWQPLSDLLEEAAHPEFEDFHNADAFDEYLESFNEAFLRSVCRVAIRLKDTNAFNCLNRTIDFRVCVIDGEEATEGDWNRLNNVRSEA